MKPTRSAKAKAATIASQTGQPNSPMPIATIMPAAPTIEPTDRSNSPAIIRRATAEPMMPTCAATSRYVAVPFRVRKPLSPATTAKMIQTRMAPATAPSSGRLSRTRVRPWLRTRSSAGSALAVAMKRSSVRMRDRWGRPWRDGPIGMD